MAQWLSLQRNSKALDNPKMPYFRLSLAPSQEGGEWVEVGVAWKSKSNKEGQYSLKIADGWKLVKEDTANYDEYPMGYPQNID